MGWYVWWWIHTEHTAKASLYTWMIHESYCDFKSTTHIYIHNHTNHPHKTYNNNFGLKIVRKIKTFGRVCVFFFCACMSGSVCNTYPYTHVIWVNEIPINWVVFWVCMETGVAHMYWDQYNLIIVWRPYLFQFFFSSCMGFLLT